MKWRTTEEFSVVRQEGNQTVCLQARMVKALFWKILNGFLGLFDQRAFCPDEIGAAHCVAAVSSIFTGTREESAHISS